MAYLYADSLAIATAGYWSDRRVQILEEITVTVTDATAFIVTVTTRAS